MSMDLPGQERPSRCNLYASAKRAEPYHGAYILCTCRRFSGRANQHLSLRMARIRVARHSWTGPIMLATAIIVFREVLEAALVVGIVLAASKGVRDRALWVAGGILAGLGGAALVA